MERGHARLARNLTVSDCKRCPASRDCARIACDSPIPTESAYAPPGLVAAVARAAHRGRGQCAPARGGGRCNVTAAPPSRPARAISTCSSTAPAVADALVDQLQGFVEDARFVPHFFDMLFGLPPRSATRSPPTTKRSRVMPPRSVARSPRRRPNLITPAS